MPALVWPHIPLLINTISCSGASLDIRPLSLLYNTPYIARSPQTIYFHSRPLHLNMASTGTLIYSVAGACILLLLARVCHSPLGSAQAFSPRLTSIQIIQNAVLSPLGKIPGPWWSSITSLPTKIAILSSRQVHFYHSLHRKYGPFVRVAPNEIIISDLASFKEIHRIGTPFIKSDFYKYLNPTEAGKGPYSVFAMTRPTEHSKRRRLLARGFSLSFLRSNWEPVVREKVAFAVERMKADCSKNGEVDILKWWIFMASDIISQLMFGESFDTLKLARVSGKTE